MTRHALLAASIAVSSFACGGDDGRTDSDGGSDSMRDGSTETDADTDGMVAQPVDTLLPTGACSNATGLFRVTVDGERYGPFSLFVSPRDEIMRDDWDIVGCENPGTVFTTSIHLVLPDGMSLPVSSLTLPHEVGAVDPVAEGFFSGSVGASEMPPAWPRAILGFRPALMGGRDSEMELRSFDGSTLDATIFTEATGGSTVEIVMNLTLD